MKKTILLYTLLALSFYSQAQITTYNAAAINDFYGIGGYSFTEGYIPNGSQPSPYVRSGPSPQNDFMYVATTPDGSALYGSFGELSTHTTNRPITLTFKGNNVRKMGLNVYEVDINEAYSSGSIVATITTNLNNTASLTSTSGARFVGFRVINENEYIVSATFSANTGFYTSLKDLMIGDDTPQNVALNFDGVDDYVSIPSAVGNFATSQNFTVTCWIKPDATQPSSATNPDENDIISKWAGLGAGANNNYPFVIRYLNTTRTNVSERGKILVGQWDGTTFTTVISTTAVNDGNWHHVAFVRETGTTAADVFKLYIDGNLEGTSTVNVGGVTTNTTPLQIGRRGNGQNYFKGEIDEVRVWFGAKIATEIANERFCKTPITINLQAAYNFSNGVPHDNNILIAQVQTGVGTTNHGTLNNFALTGDASNFVTGQVKYVKKPNFGTINGSSWATSFIELQAALVANTCNDLFDVYIAKQTYLPTDISDINASFIIPTGMSIYGGFAGTEKSINKRNRALIHSDNKTTLSGDLNGDDTPFIFNTNRDDNSKNVVQLNGSNAVFDGFTVRGANSIYSGGIEVNSSNVIINNCRFIDNLYSGINIRFDNINISNCTIAGNGDSGIFTYDANMLNVTNCLIVNNVNSGINMVFNSPKLFKIVNCTISANKIGASIYNYNGNLNILFTNTIIHGNTNAGIASIGSGPITKTITHSLVQGETSTANGNLNGNTVNPQFVSSLPNTVISDTGDYRLKWCSRAINAGDNAGISSLDLDRNPRNFNGTADMGAFEFLGNTPSQVNNSTITGTIDSPIYAGGAIQTITSTAKILAPAGKVDFKAPNSITLNPGFEARGVSNYFQAQIGANQTCVN